MNHPCTNRRWPVLLLTFCVLATGGNFAYGYDNDTHHALTYYLAIKVGYTPNEALMIANANLSVDYDEKTSPDSGSNVFKPKVRREHHAFVDVLDAYMLPRLGAGYMKKRKDELRREAHKYGNPGVLLHFVQDQYSHDGYGSLLGQLWNLVFHYPDFISADLDRASKMADESIVELQRFMREYLHREPKNVDPTELAAVLVDLSRINPARELGSPDYAKAKDVVEKALGMRMTPTIDDESSAAARIVFDDDAKKRTSAPVDTSSTPRRTPSYTPRSTPSYTPTYTPRVPTPIRPYNPSMTTPSVTYRAPSTRLSVPTVPFPTAIPSMSFSPVVRTGTMPSIGGSTFTPRVTFSDSVPKAGGAPKGVSMRIGIDRGTLSRMEAPPSLVTSILGKED